MFTWLTTLVGGGLLSTVEKIATEAIDTDKESAEAKALFVKTLDPNGLMRRDISNRVGKLYSMYIYLAVILLLLQASGYGNEIGVDKAVESIVGLFVPITTMFTAIVGASFGVNGLNTMKNK